MRAEIILDLSDEFILDPGGVEVGRRDGEQESVHVVEIMFVEDR